MNENNQMGVNLVKAAENITVFESTSNNFLNTIVDVTRNYTFDLCNLWASPNAKTFSTKFIRAFCGITEAFANEADRILENLVTACKTIATANGASFGIESITINHVDNVYEGCSECGEDNNGNVGMATEFVINATDQYIINANKALTILENLPEKLEIYNLDGSINQSYNIGKEKFLETYRRLISQTASQINKYVESEINNLKAADQEALERMQNIARANILDTEDFFA